MSRGLPRWCELSSESPLVMSISLEPSQPQNFLGQALNRGWAKILNNNHLDKNNRQLERQLPLMHQMFHRCFRVSQLYTSFWSERHLVTSTENLHCKLPQLHGQKIAIDECCIHIFNCILIVIYIHHPNEHCTILPASLYHLSFPHDMLNFWLIKDYDLPSFQCGTGRRDQFLHS